MGPCDTGHYLGPYSQHRVLCQDKSFKSEQGLRSSDKKCAQGLSAPLSSDVVWVSSTSLPYSLSAERPKKLICTKCLGRQKQEEVCEFKASLIYIAMSWPVKVT